MDLRTDSQLRAECYAHALASAAIADFEVVARQSLDSTMPSDASDISDEGRGIDREHVRAPLKDSFAKVSS